MKYSKVFLIVIIIVIIDILLSIWRNYRRYSVYNEAKQQSIKKNKKLLVIGSPSTGFWNRRISTAYGCGDICLDLVGCENCPKSLKGDILTTLKTLDTNQYVIFESCVLEYIDEESLGEVKQEIKRVCGEDYYEVRIKPYIIPDFFYTSKFVESGESYYT